MKRILFTALIVIVVVSIIFGSCLSASAVGRFDSEWGTEKGGVVMPSSFNNNIPGFYECCPGTNGFPNADFEQGLKYWASNDNKKPSQNVELVEENGNKFIRFTPTDAYDGIESLRFVDSRVKVGDSLAIMYDWRADDPSFQIVLKQYLSEPNTIKVQRLSMRAAVHVVEAYTDEEWNTTVTEVKTNEFPTSPVLEPENDANSIYLTFLLEISNPASKVEIDNLRLVTYNKTTGKIKDLDGKELYDAKNLKKDAVEEVLTEDQFADIDYNARPFTETVGENASGSNNQKSVVSKNFVEKYLWVIIGTCVVIIIAAAAVVLIVVKKKKATVPAEEISAENTPIEPPVE